MGLGDKFKKVISSPGQSGLAAATGGVSLLLPDNITSQVTSPLDSLLLGSSGKAEADAERARLLALQDAKSRAALQQYKDVDIPEEQKLELVLQDPKLVGELEAIELEQSRLGDIETDPRLREAEMAALAELDTMSEEGLTAQELALYDELRSKGLSQQQARDADIISSLARRGLVGGEGSAARTEALMKQQSAQATANEQARQARQIAADKVAARRGAMMQRANLASVMEGREYGRASEAEKARMAIEQFNKMNKQSTAAQNLAERQRIADQAANLANQKEMIEKQYNIGSDQRKFANQLALAAPQAGIISGQAAMYGQL
jgi:hypothetical protein